MRALQSTRHLLKLLGQPLYYSLITLFGFLLLILILIKKILTTIFTFLKYISIFIKPQNTTQLPTRHSLPITYRIPLTAFLLTFLLTSLSISILLLYRFIFTDLPDFHKLVYENPLPSTTKILDRHGTLLYEIFQDQNRTPILLADLPQHLIYAHIAIEDSNYYNHYGINPPDIARAAYTNMKNYFNCRLSAINCKLPIFGASTITQQLVKNTLLSQKRTWKRKLQEIILAIQIERQLTKNQILEKYLNTVSYGGTAYGIEAAARSYFSKPASKLNLAESALLAGLPAAPSTYSPFGAQPKLALQRQRQVLRRMYEEGYISKDLKLKTQNSKLFFTAPDTRILAPHFVMYLRQLLETHHGTELINQGGLEITTSLDLRLQNYAQQILKTEILKLKTLNVSNGAILITRPTTGEILTMVGSVNYFDTKNQGNFNAAIALRQPGSAIKPVNYATALTLNINTTENLQLTTDNPKMGYTAASIINDSPVTFKIIGQPPYSPTNYDNTFHGRVTLRTALASSYNVPAVKILNSYGVDKMLNMGQNLGITTWRDRSRFGLSLTLGGGEVTMIDMAVAYGTLANLGHRIDLNPVLKIQNPKSKIQNSNFKIDKQYNHLVLDPRVAFILNNILADSEARIPAFGRHSKLNIDGHTVAVKTGTSNNLRDNWTIGYTPDYLVAVWVGNFNNSPMSRIASGITGATPIWQEIMIYLLNQYKSQNLGQLEIVNSHNFPWPIPKGIVKTPICLYTSTLPCTGCPTREEYFIDGTQPTHHCSPSWFISPTPSP